ncbi:MAG TPA: cyclic nucleotide-binding domain-containing protein [Chloroflexota bacterium]|nr:cyclic nucleotide-binding domain-containing protein [Chloroflexota bacterium]
MEQHANTPPPRRDEATSLIPGIPMTIDLSQITLFRDLPADALTRLGMFARVRTFAPGHVLLRQGDLGDRLYFIVQGRVRLEHAPPTLPTRAQPLVLQEIGAGEVVGEAGLFEGQPSAVTAVAVQEVTVVQLSYVAVAVTALRCPEAVAPLRAARQRCERSATWTAPGVQYSPCA